jgi:hypothetical protein
MIPNIIHFIFGLQPDFGKKPFSLVHYLSIKSAFDVNKPEKVYFHYCYEPTGYWWDQVKPLLTLNKVEVPESIFGNKLHHFAHKADVLRLEMLKKFGGIYMDLDTISVRPLLELYAGHDFVIGQQFTHEPLSMRFKRSVKTLNHKYLLNRGLCNAVILASQDNPFVNIWYDSYREFRSNGRDEYWDEHSVIIPQKLASQHKDLVKIVSPYRFHYPIYDLKGLSNLFVRKKVFPEAYVHHLWETLSWEPYLKHLTPNQIYEVDSTYNMLARRHL